MAAVNVNSAYGPPPSNVVPDRKSANYHPSIWGDSFLAYNKSAAKTDADQIEEEHHQLLKQEVKNLLMAAGNKTGQQLIILIDEIQRLGVSYHFEAEIGTLLQQMNDIFPRYCARENDEELHDIALCFRLLRQQGHKVSSDVFDKFKDSNGKFKECLAKDMRGLLSLYEATHLRVHGEQVLEEALEFSTFHLNQHLDSNLSDPYADLVRRALKYPIRKSLTRLAARHYISIYHKFQKHNKLLLDFAKIDFNLVQKLHQQEIGHISRWWKDLDFAKKLSFARDRVVECYFWISGVYFEPRYSKARVLLTKVISLTSIVDDTYDVYGKVEELELFTDAIQRWDISTIDQLPEYMRFVYKPLLDVFAEAEEELTIAGKTLHGVGYSKDSFKRLTRSYLHESKWCKEGYFPTFEEYMKVALVSGAYKMLSVTSFVLMGDVVSKEAFEWISNDPLIVRAASVICRLSDDIVGHEFEKKRDHIPTAVECYMEQHGLSKDTTYVELRKIITNAWKDMNQECLNPTAVPMPLLERVFNLARVINLLYDDGNDGYTHSSTGTKDMIIKILVDPVPV